MSNLAVAKLNGRIVGGCMYIWNKEVADVFILSGDSDYYDYGVNHAITAFSTRYFHKISIRWFNWQSSKKRNDGVYIFKKQWGSTEIPYQFLTWTFPGFETLFSADIQKVYIAYQWHYVAPFDAIRKRLYNGIFHKS